MSNVDCGVENPEVPGMLCGKAPHPYGAHMDAVTSTVWEGLLPPQKRAKGSRVKEVVDVIGGAGHNVATGPPVLPEHKTGEQLRDEAIARGEAATTPEFRMQAREVLHQVAREMDELTAEDVMDRLTVVTHDNRAMGAIMLHGAKEGWIDKTDPEKFVQSRYPRRHKMDVRVWKSLIRSR